MKSLPDLLILRLTERYKEKVIFMSGDVNTTYFRLVKKRNTENEYHKIMIDDSILNVINEYDKLEAIVLELIDEEDSVDRFNIIEDVILNDNLEVELLNGETLASINECATYVDLIEVKIFEDFNNLPVKDYLELLNFHTTNNIFKATLDFQQKYGLWEESEPKFIDDDKLAVKIGHLDEELAEVKEALKNKDLGEFFDGLIDLIYIASGTLNLCNAPADLLWKDVQIRNMQKVRATSNNVGKRGTTFDVVKPPGWTGPITDVIIENYKSSPLLNKEIYS